MNFNHYSSGKLLLTGEYLVMHGAKALAFPVNYGQDLRISCVGNCKEELEWKANEQNKTWFEAILSISNLDVISTSPVEKASYLSEILRKARALNPNFLAKQRSFRIETNTNFPINWGLGTSSTLINNIAIWAKVNPFELHSLVSKGSGYDIACASANKPIIYKNSPNGLHEIKEVEFNKPYLNKLYFVFSGRKMNTEKHISEFVSKTADYNFYIQQIDYITEQILKTSEFHVFKDLIIKHEEIISKLIKQKTIQEQEFSNFKGVVKSLGAWGGDFILAISDEGTEYIQEYFEQLGLSVIIPFRNMVL